jgi:hypothetical protein
VAQGPRVARARPRGLLVVGAAAALLLLGGSERLERPASATTRFIQSATETTVPNVLYPWTQSDACSCCVCWETALSTIFAYWDDYTYQGYGPWERLLYGGNGADAYRFNLVSGYIYNASGVACSAGTSWATPVTQGDDTKSATYVSNTYYGYSFTYDEDIVVFFSSDIKAEIDADKPVYFAYYPEGSGSHAITIVGYDDSDDTLFLYKNWSPVVTRKGYDEATYKQDIDITPGGRSSTPSSWTCASSSWEGRDGCSCNCGGAYDPDCDDTSQTLKGCTGSQTCDLTGQCAGKTCTDACQSGKTRCISSSTYQACGDFNLDGCTDWGSTKTCHTGTACSGSKCVLTCSSKCQINARQCADSTHAQICVTGTDGCATWGAKTTCAKGQTCVKGQCKAENCTNGVDDDGDQLIDCTDPDCASDPTCVVSGSPDASVPSSGGESISAHACSCELGRASSGPPRLAGLLLLGLVPALALRRRRRG